ncbi:hypothetical protein [Oceanitalea stevensii]|uniref:Ribbon-helix-helix domain-containing protein n=1 Tax=Oceanitalea stevensii TaxID=2763072 RepID=A0ABR8YZ29_9MICO|nr:hypothetical protein [Oceanitalea stevensii]MBD8061048.1 hypothetical protein [Oceanitalea stevensii]
MSLMLRKGEKVPMKGRTVTVTATAFDCLPRVRDRLIEAARTRETMTYGELRNELALPYLTQGMGWLLDLVSEDCFRRGEPSLASLVVNASTGEVGSDFDGDAPSERDLVFAHRNWS